VKRKVTKRKAGCRAVALQRLDRRFLKKSLAKTQWSNTRWVFLFTEKEK